MGPLVVVDTDVLIAFFSDGDAHHERAVSVVRAAVDAPADLAMSAVNFSELLVRPLRHGGQPEADRLADRLRRLQVDIVPADAAHALAVASVRARTGLKLPDAYAVATALAARGARDDVRLETFDERALSAFEEFSR